MREIKREDERAMIGRGEEKREGVERLESEGSSY
jgi:hypothetical protein